MRCLKLNITEDDRWLGDIEIFTYVLNIKNKKKRFVSIIEMH